MGNRLESIQKHVENVEIKVNEYLATIVRQQEEILDSEEVVLNGIDDRMTILSQTIISIVGVEPIFASSHIFTSGQDHTLLLYVLNCLLIREEHNDEISSALVKVNGKTLKLVSKLLSMNVSPDQGILTTKSYGEHLYSKVALHVAISRSRRAVTLLLDYFADVDIQTQMGTPLEYAVRKNRVDVVEEMLTRRKPKSLTKELVASSPSSDMFALLNYHYCLSQRRVFY